MVSFKKGINCIWKGWNRVANPIGYKIDVCKKGNKNHKLKNLYMSCKN